jgi:hypothetical protein
LLYPVVSISPHINKADVSNKADVTAREMLDSAFRQNFDGIAPGIKLLAGVGLAQHCATPGGW